MDASWLELVKLWGPLSLGWCAAAYLGKFIMDRYDKDIDAKVKLSTALDSLTSVIKERISNVRHD